MTNDDLRMIQEVLRDSARLSNADADALTVEIARLGTSEIGPDRIQEIVRQEVLDRTACVAGWDGFLPGSIERMANDIARRVADRLVSYPSPPATPSSTTTKHCPR